MGKKKKKISEIVLPKHCTIENVVKLKEEIMDSIQNQSNTVLDFSEVEEVDLAFLQVLVALFDTVKPESEKSISLKGMLSNGVKESLYYAGLINADEMISSNDLYELLSK